MTQTPEKTETATLTLCQCCAMKLANDDDSSCRDFHKHTHADLSVPAGAVLVDLEPTRNEGARYLVCDGHGEKIAPLAHYWIIEVLSDPAVI